MPRRLSLQLASLLFACGLVACAHAAELGDIKVNSFIGQHLSADIELTSLDDPAAQVQVRLASLDVYRGANLDMPAVLAHVNLSVMRRDGKQFLHVTSTRPVDADHLHLYLDLADGNRRGVRLATLWFSPDPTPPAVPERVAIPMTAPAAALASTPSRKSRPIRPLPQSPVLNATKRPATDLFGAPNGAAAAPAAVSAKAPVLAEATSKAATPTAARSKAAAPAEANAKAGAPVEANPQAPAPAQASAKAAETTDPRAKTRGSAEPSRAALPLVAGQPARPAPLKLAKTPAAPVCGKQPPEAESACTAFDSKNAELRAEIGKLEARVNSLLGEQNSRSSAVSQPAAQAAPQRAPQHDPRSEPQHEPRAALPGPEQSPAAEPVGQTASGKVKPVQTPSAHAAAPAARAAAARKAGVATAEEAPPGMPWGWIAGAGAAVFATIGALQFWRHRRKRPKTNTVHAPLPDEEDHGQVEPTFG